LKKVKNCVKLVVNPELQENKWAMDEFKYYLEYKCKWCSYWNIQRIYISG
jgi:transposase